MPELVECSPKSQLFHGLPIDQFCHERLMTLWHLSVATDNHKGMNKIIEKKKRIRNTTPKAKQQEAFERTGT
jgi:hypothetical protein